MATSPLIVRLALPTPCALGPDISLAVRVEDVGAGDRAPAVLAQTGLVTRRLDAGEAHVDVTLDLSGDALARAELPTVWAHVRPAGRASGDIRSGDLITATATDPRAPGADGRLRVDLQEVG